MGEGHILVNLKGNRFFLVWHLISYAIGTQTHVPREATKELGKDENLPAPSRQDLRALLWTHVPGAGEFASSKPSPTFCLLTSDA